MQGTELSGTVVATFRSEQVGCVTMTAASKVSDKIVSLRQAMMASVAVGGRSAGREVGVAARCGAAESRRCRPR
eukprot:IDg214t1